MKLLYEYNEDGTYKCDKLVNSLKDVLITSAEEKQLIDDEEVIVQVPLETPVLPEGLTDVKPTGTVIPNISPVYDPENKTWTEDVEAVKSWKATLPPKLPTDIEVLGQMVSDLMLENAKKDKVISQLGQEVTAMKLKEVN